MRCSWGNHLLQYNLLQYIHCIFSMAVYTVYSKSRSPAEDQKTKNSCNKPRSPERSYVYLQRPCYLPGFSHLWSLNFLSYLIAWVHYPWLVPMVSGQTDSIQPFLFGREFDSERGDCWYQLVQYYSGGGAHWALNCKFHCVVHKD